MDGTGTFVQDYEYYDYANYLNRGEVSYPPSGVSPSGSDYSLAFNSTSKTGIPGILGGNGHAANSLLSLMAGQFGEMWTLTSAVPGTTVWPTGIVEAMLTRTLTGQAPAGTNLSTYTAEGIGAWYTWLHSHMSCSS